MIIKYTLPFHVKFNFSPIIWLNVFIYTGCFFNSVIYDLALIQSFFGIFEIVRKFVHRKHWGIFKNAKTLLI